MTTLPAASQPIFELHIPADVRVGSLQYFLFLCAQQGLRGKIKTIRFRKELSLVLEQTENLRLIYTVGGQKQWIVRTTVANKSSQARERLERKRGRRKTKPLWTQPCWTGEPRPADYDAAGMGLDYVARFIGVVRAAVRCDAFELIPRNSFRYAAPKRIRPKKFEPKPIPYDGEFSIRDITAQIGKHSWSDAMNRAVYDLFVTNETEPLPLSAAEIAGKHGVHVRSLYTYSEKMRRQMPKRPVTETIFVAEDGTPTNV